MSSRNPFAPLLLLLLAFALPARAGDVCVDTVSELVSAFQAFSSQPDGSTYSIKIVEGTYNVGNQLGNTLSSYPNSVGLSITGGYNPGCSTRDLNPAFTVIDGGDQYGSGIVFELYGDANAIVDRLTFGNLYDGDIAFGIRNFGNSSDQASYRIQHCRFRANLANRIVDMHGPQMQFFNNLVAKNGAVGAGSAAVNLRFLFHGDSGAIVTNNTIADNVADGLAIRTDTAGGQPTSRQSEATNNILWSNGLDLNLFNFEPGGHAISVEGNVIGSFLGSPTLGTTNLSSDPKFVNVAAESYALQSISPAINSGFMFQWFGFPGVDLVGNERIVGTHIDRGALESSLDNRTDFLVTNVGDNGDNVNPLVGSLRAGIKAANAAAGPFRIGFAIGGSCPRIINVMTPMLDVTGDVTIDGRTQPGWSPNTIWGQSNASLCVVLNGAGATAHAFRIPATAGSTARLSVFGLMFAAFTDAAIRLENGHDHRIVGNQFGAVPFTAANGTAVRVSGSSGGAFIGGYGDPEVTNVIAGSSGPGLYFDNSAGGNVVAHNLIGYQTDGLSAGGNQSGVLIYNSPGNVLEINRIGYSTNNGVTLAGPSSQGNRIQNNNLGVVLGQTSGNGGAGVGISFGAHHNTVGAPMSAGYGKNAIGGNGGAGVWISPTGGIGNLVLANWYGTNGGIDIDLATAGASANQATSPSVGPNQLQNYPTLTLVQRTTNTSPGMLIVTGQLHSIPNALFRIDIYLGTCHPSVPTRGVAEDWIAPLFVLSDAQGNASFSESFSLAVGASSNGHASATATSVSGGDTSEIGECEPVMPIELPDALFQNGFEST
mgnify:CR=1 FL=1